VRDHGWIAGSTLVLLFVLLLVPAPAALAQTTVLSGQIDGAYYRIEVPADWNGALAIWNHGLGLANSPRPLDHADLGRLADGQLSQGIAVAATGLRTGGWALFDAVDDLTNLLAEFSARVGPPDRVFLAGASMGALTSVFAVESEELPVDGVLALCGPMAGARFWDTSVDLRLTYDLVCAGVPDAAIPGGVAGLPEGGQLTAASISRAFGHCIGTREPTLPGGSERLARLVDATLVDGRWLPFWMLISTIGLSDLVHDPAKLDGLIGAGNASVVYEDPVVDAGIARVEPDFLGELALWQSSTPLGVRGTARIVSLHTSLDGLAMPEHATELADRVPADRLTVAIVEEQRPSHCGFTRAEDLAGWDALVDWVETGVQPDVAALQARCEALAVGYATCRFDPDADPGPLDDVIRPRSGILDRLAMPAPLLPAREGDASTDPDSGELPDFEEGLSLDPEAEEALRSIFETTPLQP
jgi:alpha-beta hydrolase superfamily lysophospholipase